MPKSLQVNLGHVDGETRQAWDCDIATVALMGAQDQIAVILTERGSPAFMSKRELNDPADLRRVIRALTVALLEHQALLDEQ